MNRENINPRADSPAPLGFQLAPKMPFPGVPSLSDAFSRSARGIAPRPPPNAS